MKKQPSPVRAKPSRPYFSASDTGRQVADPELESNLGERRTRITRTCEIIWKAIWRRLRSSPVSVTLKVELCVLRDLCQTMYQHLEALRIEPEYIGPSLELRVIQKTRDGLHRAVADTLPPRIAAILPGLVAEVDAFLELAYTAPLCEPLHDMGDLRAHLIHRAANMPAVGSTTSMPSNAEIMGAIERLTPGDRPDLVVTAQALRVDLPTIAGLWLDKHPDGTWQNLSRLTGKSRSTLYSKSGPWMHVRLKLLAGSKAASGSIQSGIVTEDRDGGFSADGVGFDSDEDEARYRRNTR